MIIHDVEQGTDEWYQARCGRATASEFSKIITTQGAESKQIEDYALILAIEKYTGVPAGQFGGSRATERGKALESEARIAYQVDNQVNVDQVGFVTDNLMRYGCSPDGLVGKDGGTEFKCKTDKEHMAAVLYYYKHGQILPQYYAQPQGCMFVTGRKWWDLMFYHPDLPCITVRQYQDQLFFKSLRKYLKRIDVLRNTFYELIIEQPLSGIYK